MSEDVVLVAAKAGTKGLAGFGNFVRRETAELAKVRLSVWDDEAAWKRFAAAEEAESEVLAHKRAEYLKEAGPDPVDRFVVFDEEGNVAYQRDFLAWPLTELDD